MWRKDHDKTKKFCASDATPNLPSTASKAARSTFTGKQKALDQHLKGNRKQHDQQLQATELDTTSIIHCTPTLSKSLNFYVIFTHLQGRQLKVYIFCNRDTLLDRTNSGCGQKLIAHSPLKLRGRKTLFS